MNPAVEAILNAWTVPGPALEYHLSAQYRLRREWPVLATALDQLAAEAREGRL